MHKASLVQSLPSHRVGPQARRIVVLYLLALVALLVPLIFGAQPTNPASMRNVEESYTPFPAYARGQQPALPSLSGRWKIVSGGGKYSGIFELQQSGTKLTGSVRDTNNSSVGQLEGSIEGRRVRLTRRWPGGTQTYDLMLDATYNRMSGTLDGTRDMTVGNDAQLERENSGSSRTTEPPTSQDNTGPSLSGRWNIVSGSGKYKGIFELQQSATKLTGSVRDTNNSSVGQLEGSIEGRRVRLTRRWPGGTQTYDLTLDATYNRMNGTLDGTRDMTVGNDAQLEREGGGSIPPPPPTKSLTGAWVHSADSSTQTPNGKVIVIQDGSMVTLINSYKAEGTQGYWVTLVCTGPLSSGEVRLRCNWAPGGNPLGFAGNFLLVMRVSADGYHMDSAPQSATGMQESHYSRMR
jgi:hypothetical protein